MGRGGPLMGSPVRGSLLLDGDRIAAVGTFDAPSDCEVRDCTGLAIAPGFIDLHSHADLQVLENRTEKLKQGVTTEVVGNWDRPPDRRPEGQVRFRGQAEACPTSVGRASACPRGRR